MFSTCTMSVGQSTARLVANLRASYSKSTATDRVHKTRAEGIPLNKMLLLAGDDDAQEDPRFP
jgi:hypothetical protein